MNKAERLAALLADPAVAGSDLAVLCKEFIADQERLHNRLERISRISDGYQGELMRTNRELAAANERLAAALNDIRTLSGFIPICSRCKRVRDDGGYWDEVETYITRHSEAVLGYSVCPACSGGPRGHTDIALAETQHDEADAEEQRLAVVLANEAWKGHPLASEYQRLSLGFQKLTRRLNKISRISDGFQTQLKHLNTALALASLTDPLTTLANRRAMLERLAQAAEANIKGGPGFAVAMIDIDHFKRVNDSFGHAVGDAALRALADTLAGMRHEHDFAARWGGEEFLLLIMGVDAATLRDYCESVRVAVEALRIEHNDKRMRITISIGMAIHERVLSFEDTIRDADRALYAAKSYGRNAVVCADDL
jgi:diguanylate cyclase (GGDEF)-like protein